MNDINIARLRHCSLLLLWIFGILLGSELGFWLTGDVQSTVLLVCLIIQGMCVGAVVYVRRALRELERRA